MNKAILNKAIQEFIDVNLRVDINEIILKSKLFDEVKNRELAVQISGKLKSKSKLPTWFETENIIYPAKISIEQTSSEQTAKYKSSLVFGKNLVDLTGGFGVDDYYFSKQFESIIHCEINEELSQITAHNFAQLGVTNCEFYFGDGIEYLEQTNEKFDCIYVDPSRRSEIKGKVFLMSDCLPDVPSNDPLLFHRSNIILMKTSPLIDLTQGLEELLFVKEIHIVAVKNEVKELLWIMEKNCQVKVEIKTINILSEQNQVFNFIMEEENSLAQLSIPQSFLYEPNSAIMKSGGFNQVAMKFGVSKLHLHSHLYTSDELVEFPGRAFKIVEVLDYNTKALKKQFGGKKANITTRNFPLKVEEIRKKLKIKDGGEVYLFFTTNKEEKKQVLVCEKV